MPAPVFASATEAKAYIDQNHPKASVVLANGCYDILHVGHIRFLLDAKKEGDLLAVAANSDASVEKFKGRAPLVPETERLEMLSALEMVDMVFPFSERTADAVIETIKPAVQAKGTDYDPEKLLELDTLKKVGGRVAICGDPKDHSSTEMKRRIKDDS